MISLEKLIDEKKILVCVGTGGVGKTTTAAALGYKAAKMGKRVLVLTVDPARRLATSLSIDLNKIEPTRVETFEKGFLEASVIQPEEVFHRFVRENSETEEQAEKMMKNRLYIQLTKKLSGSQEFTSLEWLSQKARSGDYDLVVLDTPPAQQARDFFKAPVKLHSLFQGSVTRWFVQSGEAGLLKKILASGTDKVLKVLEQLTGAGFLVELREFFSLAQSWQEVLSQRMVEVHRLLTGRETAFVLITAFDTAKLREALSFQRELKREGYSLSSMVINRAFPPWFAQKEAPTEAPVAELYEKMRRYYDSRREQLLNYRREMGENINCYEVPDFFEDVSDLAGISQIAHHFS